MSRLVLKNVSKTYGQGNNQVQALKPTDFSAQAGEFIAIVGPSGSGKTTFLTILGNLQTPTTGQVLIDGQDTVPLSDKARGRLRFETFGFILQASNLLPFLTVEDQLHLVDRLAKTKRPGAAKELLADLGLTQVAKAYPHQLSGGQKQRVAIARALYNQPKIVLADEPTASLDTARALQVADLLAQVARERQCTVIMITHDTRLLDKVDKVYYMEDGCLTAAPPA